MGTPDLLLTHVDYVDVIEGRIRTNNSIRVREGRIHEIVAGKARSNRGEQVLDLSDRVVMPGLIDCHVHCSPHLGGPAPALPSTLALHSARRAFRMLRRGFTTVRDAGGTDAGLKYAISKRVVPGPRLFVAGKALSQTGGHGDPRDEFHTSQIVPLTRDAIGFGRVVDGVDEVIRATREELRLGADQIKIVACGGVGSARGGLEQTQFADDEIRAAVAEASRAGTYVMAHAYGSRGVSRLVELGVRTIEHGNLIDGAAAEHMAAAGAFLVPNYVAYRSLSAQGRDQGYPDAGMERLQVIVEAGTRGLELASAAGVKIAYGSDLVKDPDAQSDEFLIRSEVASPLEIIRSATCVGAEVVGMAGSLGIVAQGARADLLAVDGSPLDDIALLTDQGSHLSLILKDGLIEKEALNNDIDEHWIATWFPAEDPTQN